MALSDYKITQEETAANGVVSAPDVLTGTAQENKAVFDKLINQTVMVKHNGLIDELSTSGAGDTGITDIPGLVAETVQEALEEINANVGEIIDPNNPETAGKIGSLPFQGVEAANVQDALEEIQKNLDAAVSAIQQDIPQAEEVLVTPFPGVTSDNVQDALEELNEKVEDIQSGVIPTGSITSDMLQDGAVTADKLGSDVTGDTIPTSASDPTSISSQLSNAITINNGITMVGEIDSVSQLPSNRSCVFRTTNSDWDGALPSKYTPYARFRSSHFGAYSFWLGVDADQAMWFARPVPEDGIPTLNDWRKVAVATPPQEFDLPLAEGVTPIGGFKTAYSKDQFGIVRVWFSVHFESIPSNNAHVFYLPEGFRPDFICSFTALLSMVEYYTSSILVHPSGEATVDHGTIGQTGPINLHGFIEFPAAD